MFSTHEGNATTTKIQSRVELCCVSLTWYSHFELATLTEASFDDAHLAGGQVNLEADKHLDVGLLLEERAADHRLLVVFPVHGALLRLHLVNAQIGQRRAATSDNGRWCGRGRGRQACFGVQILKVSIRELMTHAAVESNPTLVQIDVRVEFGTNKQTILDA